MPVLSWLACLAAIASTAVCLFLWFRDVRRVMRERQSMVKSAAGQLTVYRERLCRNPDDPETAAVLERSERIYRQAVDTYNQTLQKLWVCLPAALMGFKRLL